MDRIGFRGAHPAAAFFFYAAALTVSMTATHPALPALSLFAAVAMDLRFRGRRALRFFGGAVLPLMLLITAANGLFSHYGVTTLFLLPGGNRFTLEALAFGGIFALRAGTALVWLQSFHLVLTAEKWIRLFGRFSPKTALVISMALRFLPLMTEQSAQIAAAERGSGCVPTGFVGRLRAVTRRLSVLFSWVLERGVDTADSMRARGYGLPGRRCAADSRFSFVDRLILCLSAGGAAAYFALFSALRANYNPVIELPALGAAQIALLSGLTLVFFTPLIFDITEKQRWKL